MAFASFNDGFKKRPWRRFDIFFIGRLTWEFRHPNPEFALYPPEFAPDHANSVVWPRGLEIAASTGRNHLQRDGVRNSCAPKTPIFTATSIETFMYAGFGRYHI